ncbi:MAG TPA: hypothetical protein VGH28_10730 [Polyangiaceae bacterium]
MKVFAIFVFCMGCGGGISAVDAGPDAALDASEAADAGGAFVTGVVSFDAGPCSGFGAAEMPQVIEGPPVGGGTSQGSTDVVSLGVGGSIVLSFAPNAIVDGDGVDFVVFENAFDVAGNPSDVYAEPGEVSVSDDGVTWSTFPCTATAGNPPYGECAGTHPVTSPPAAPTDYPNCGGDGFDLAELGVARARYVRIVDHSGETCDPQQPTKNAGFDLDAVVILHAQPN